MNRCKKYSNSFFLKLNYFTTGLPRIFRTRARFHFTPLWNNSKSSNIRMWICIWHCLGHNSELYRFNNNPTLTIRQRLNLESVKTLFDCIVKNRYIWPQRRGTASIPFPVGLSFALSLSSLYFTSALSNHSFMAVQAKEFNTIPVSSTAIQTSISGSDNKCKRF